MAVSEPAGFASGGGGGGALSAHGRRWAPRRHVSDVNLAIGGGPAAAEGAAGERGEVAGFPVHVSCIAIRGGFLATAAGDTLHYTIQTVHYTALHCTTLHTTPNYTTLHYTTLYNHYMTLHYTVQTLHFSTPYYTTLHCTTLHPTSTIAIQSRLL